MVALPKDMHRMHYHDIFGKWFDPVDECPDDLLPDQIFLNVPEK